jgi:hypothetical protein
LTRSCSPLVMKILVPLRVKLPSVLRTAVVVRAPTSDPAWDSVSSMVPPHLAEVSILT